jgi:hypothetical protein
MWFMHCKPVVDLKKHYKIGAWLLTLISDPRGGKTTSPILNSIGIAYVIKWDIYLKTRKIGFLRTVESNSLIL